MVAQFAEIWEELGRINDFVIIVEQGDTMASSHATFSNLRKNARRNSSSLPSNNPTISDFASVAITDTGTISGQS